MLCCICLTTYTTSCTRRMKSRIYLYRFENLIFHTGGHDDGPCILSSYMWMFTDALFLRDTGSVPGCFGYCL